MGERSEEGRARLRIGAVARLTGLSVHALRKWEERYRVVEPFRTESGERLYSREDVHRLALLKRLVAGGVPLGELAGLSLDELERVTRELTADASAAPRPAAGAGAGRVAVAGETLARLVAPELESGGRAAAVATADSLGALAARLDGEPVDVLVAEFQTLHAGSTRTVLDGLARCGARYNVVVYGFAAARPLSELRAAGCALMRAPIDPGALRDLVDRLLTQGAAAQPAESVGEPGAASPRLSREAITRLAQVIPAVDCECPHHLADLIHSLLAFEQYSAECKVAHPQDADFHGNLQTASARVRSTFEQALVHLAREAGIDPEPGSGRA